MLFYRQSNNNLFHLFFHLQSEARGRKYEILTNADEKENHFEIENRNIQHFKVLRECFLINYILSSYFL